MPNITISIRPVLWQRFLDTLPDNLASPLDPSPTGATPAQGRQAIKVFLRGEVLRDEMDTWLGDKRDERIAEDNVERTRRFGELDPTDIP